MQTFFSLGKYFEKEKDVRGIPQESVHFRWVFLKCNCHPRNLKIEKDEQISCVLCRVKNNLKEHIKIPRLKKHYNKALTFSKQFFFSIVVHHFG